jgi:hypothetical protein
MHMELIVAGIEIRGEDLLRLLLRVLLCCVRPMLLADDGKQ